MSLQETFSILSGFNQKGIQVATLPFTGAPRWEYLAFVYFRQKVAWCWDKRDKQIHEAPDLQNVKISFTEAVNNPFSGCPLHQDSLGTERITKCFLDDTFAWCPSSRWGESYNKRNNLRKQASYLKDNMSLSFGLSSLSPWWKVPRFPTYFH